MNEIANVKTLDNHQAIHLFNYHIHLSLYKSISSKIYIFIDNRNLQLESKVSV